MGGGGGGEGGGSGVVVDEVSGTANAGWVMVYAIRSSRLVFGFGRTRSENKDLHIHAKILRQRIQPKKKKKKKRKKRNKRRTLPYERSKDSL
ncbi:hypothetical protein M0804_009322 [Polistes exclamans]|nr:hypothetical protein M0804_009322 [Polistes exclamans]